MAEPTSTLTFSHLIREVARKMGVAYYGAAGDGVLQVPVNTFDLDECKRLVNNGIRMFINDAPPGGWRWTRPVADLVLWPDVAVVTGQTVSGGSYSGGQTTITANASVFYPSMELKDIVITGVGTFQIASYTSATVIVVTGDASTASGATFSIASEGNFTLPQTFGGAFLGDIGYAAGTNRGLKISWTGEADIRAFRENQNETTGQPWLAAVRPMTEGSPRRRWELLVYPVPDEVLTVQFPYQLHFDSLVNLTDTPPAPFVHDEAIKAACLAAVEMDVEDGTSQHTAYYRDVCLRQSYLVDARSAPARLGYFGNGAGGLTGSSAIRTFRDQIMQRPTVTYL